jgi:hypothetical protein
MKLSFIMQSYLGDYPNSRQNASHKFDRAVQSVLNQNNPNWELIIISDGCRITKQKMLLTKEYKDPRIIFKYIDRPNDRLMYTDGITRGEPRQIGRELATGDWIGYIDSDDYLIPTAVDELIKTFEKVESISQTRDADSEIKAIWNRGIIENISYYAVIQQLNKDKAPAAPIAITKPMEFEGLPSAWIGVQTVAMGTTTIFHKPGFPDHKWEDGTTSGVSEDMLFINKIIKETSNNVGTIVVPCYVRCHLRNLWDF